MPLLISEFQPVFSFVARHLELSKETINELIDDLFQQLAKGGAPWA